jgi:chaperonin cofactor prefoldin
MALTAETSELKASLESYRATCQALEDSNAALQQRCSQVEAQLVQQALLNVERTSLQDPASPQPQDDSSSVPGVRPAESSVSLAEHEAAVGRVQALEAERSTLESKLDEVTATLAAEQAQSQGLAAQVAELSSR